MRSPLKVRLGDPIDANLTYVNDLIPEGEALSALIIYGHKDNDKFHLLGFQRAGVPYIVGAVADDVAPTRGQAKRVTIPTVAYKCFPNQKLHDVFSLIGVKHDFKPVYSDIYSGRVIGFSLDEFFWWVLGFKFRGKLDVEDRLHIVSSEQLEYQHAYKRIPVTPQFFGIRIIDVWYEHVDKPMSWLLPIAILSAVGIGGIGIAKYSRR